MNGDIMNLKKVFITGAGSGLGKEAAIALARRGHTVYASVHYASQIASLRELALQESLDLHVFHLDVLDSEDRKQILDYDIDVFISNAAIGDSGSVAEVDINRIINVFNTNIFGNLHCIQLALKNMITIKKSGRIVILTSLAGRIPAPFLSPYCASKFALEAFTTCLRQEMRLLKDSHIEVCAIEPGAYATGFNKENNEKKYPWMEEKSYFHDILHLLRYYEEKIWNFIEIKPFDSIIRLYVKTVEAKHVRHRYTAPWYQSLLIQLGRILGM